jgi:hypothetical protein
MTFMIRWLRTLTAMFFGLIAAEATAAQIVSPPPGTLVDSGSSVQVTVAPSPGEQITQVRLVTAAGSTTLAPGVLQGTVTIPQSAVGPEFIMAHVTLASGRASLPFIQVTANPGPIEELMVAGPPILDRIGQVVRLEVKGRFEDGVVRDLEDSERGTVYQATHPDILAVHPNGFIQARSRGIAQVVVRSHGKSSVVTIPVRVPSPPDNHIPVPNAGPDLTLARETFIELSGTGSQDSDGDPIRYSWHQESGPTVLIRDADTAHPYFVTPFVTEITILELALVVRDSRGATSFPDLLRITVTP